MDRLDHLVYVVPDLDGAIDDLERRLGVRAEFGGVHPNWGTRNALLALGGRRYLEILAPDPEQAAPTSSLWLGAIADGELPRIATWAAAADQLESRVAEARKLGVPLGDARRGARTRADGVTLNWQLTEPGPYVADGIIPFLIDWGTSPHPAESAPPGAMLVDLRAEHPDPARVRAMLDALGLAIEVVSGPRAAIVATLETPRGPVELR